MNAIVESGSPTPVHYLALGATLYMPATRPDLAAVLGLEKLPGLRSVIICTEDAVHARDLPLALANLARILEQRRHSQPAVFIRARGPAVLRRLLAMPGIETIAGIVLPKVTPQNLPALAELLARVPALAVMPTIETADAFDRRQLDKLRDALRELINPVLCLRIGGNDLLHLLGLKRPRGLTLYDTPLRGVIDDIILSFNPAGYDIAAPAFEYLDSPDSLAREVELDVARGLLSKTAIHPAQRPLIEGAYRVSAQDKILAERILDPQAPAVFRHDGQMCEPATHRRWAERLLLRAELFGMR